MWRVTRMGQCCTVRPALLLQGDLEAVIIKKAFPARVKQCGIIWFAGLDVQDFQLSLIKGIKSMKYR